jgi:phospholipid-binding lipoprotein MlaA
MRAHHCDLKKLQKFKQIVFLSLTFPFLYVSIPYAHVAYDFSSLMVDVIPKRITDESTIENEYRWTGDYVSWMSVSSEAVPATDETASDRFTESQAEEYFGFEEEFEEEFKERPESKVFDPLHGYNRFMTKVNDKFYFWLLKPTASGYRKVAPQSVRLSINRFFNNLLFPVRFVNNVLQLKFKGAGVELARFGVNTTLGVVGFGDPATKWFDLNAYPEDFGQTLGYYGIGGGFHLVLPILGPSNLRDTVGLVADFYLDPICYIGTCYADDWEPAIGIQAYKGFNYTSLHIGEYESLKKDAIDLYPFLRDAYEQSRKREIAE